jgi:LysM repeat protein
VPGPIERGTAYFIMLIGLMTVVASCGAGSATPPASTVAVTSTAYVTVPARSTTTTAAPRPEDASETGDQGDNSGDEDPESSAADDPNRERIHEIVSGDYLVGIARDYDVPINYIPEYNGWDDGLGHALVPGETLRIPPADWLPEDERGAATTGDSDTTDPQAELCEDGEAPETYRIRAGDTPARVAAAHDVTTAELNAANADTEFYSGFVVGITINIPC